MTDTQGSVPVRRPIIAWDLVVSIVILAAGLVFLMISAVVDLFSAALIGSCPRRSCNPGEAVASLGISWFVMLLIVAAGAIVAIVLIRRRRHSWWVALLAFVLMVAAWIVGFILYSHAVRNGGDTGGGTLAALAETPQALWRNSAATSRG
ncbi:MAG: hypothetical protein JWM49_2667 [Microbacteriaceae bacterium]|jgi:uncharacterized BrkB/YihY/UPF0761 family membrane protein|nr:hypothetical protein [Microbacteriaceae bacterium]